MDPELYGNFSKKERKILPIDHTWVPGMPLLMVVHMNGRRSETSMTWLISLQEVTKFYKYLVGISALNLCPNIKGEGIDWNFMGIFSKNREEWAIIDFACLRSDITIVPFYDSLGKEALSLVLNSTEVTTMCIEKNTLEVLIKLKETECKHL